MCTSTTGYFSQIDYCSLHSDPWSFSHENVWVVINSWKSAAKSYTIHSMKISPLKINLLYNRPHTWIKLFQLQESEQLTRDVSPNSLKSLSHTRNNNTTEFVNFNHYAYYVHCTEFWFISFLLAIFNFCITISRSVRGTIQ